MGCHAGDASIPTSCSRDHNLGFDHRGFLRAVSNRVQQYRLKDMNTQDISNFSWGFATFYDASRPAEFQDVFRVLADGVAARVHEFVLPQSISNTLWAFATV